MFKRYKEIYFGVLLGAAMWVVDAAMHTQLGAELHASHNFWLELVQPHATTLLFRIVFVFIATLFGWALWRANWRERELRALEDAIITFHRRIDSPAMRILSHARMLHGRPGVMHDEAARELATSISDDARVIDELAQQYMRFSQQVRAGLYREATETLRRIEAWASEGRSGADGQADDAPRTPAT
ncbi:MAG: hypothetical protein M3R15_33780 [Acidobacteriota bacterium]|nr:hypothetical protein [Acidobacteriota bacterium]